MNSPVVATVTGSGDGLWGEGRRLARLFRVVTHIARGFMLALFLGAFRAPQRPVVRRAARRWLAQLLGILGITTEIRGAPAAGSAMLVSNHVSWLDIPVLGAQTEVCFLSKAEVRDWPLIGHLAAAAGTLFIRRGAGESGRKARQIADHLAAGHRVLVFPEGTTTDGLALRRFFSPLFQAPLDAGVPVQPVTLRYLDETGAPDPSLAFLGQDALTAHLWRLLRRRRIRVRVDYGLTLAGAGDRHALCRRAHEAVAARLA